MGNRLTALNLAKDQAFQAGDLERLNAIDTEILEVQNTLIKLNLVSSIEQTASVTSFTEAQVVQHGIDASTGLGTLNSGSTSCLDEYDISSYATDPLHEQKIREILEDMGYMDSVTKVNEYINYGYSGSPVTGDMVMRASGAYTVDARLMMALMELDSRFGTVGIGARTFNPGNVGNTGEEMRTYSSWDDGVAAVGLWLSNHRKVKIPTPIPATVPIVEPVIVEPASTPAPESQPAETSPQVIDGTSVTPVSDTEPLIPSTEDTFSTFDSTSANETGTETTESAPSVNPIEAPISRGRGRNTV